MKEYTVKSNSYKSNYSIHGETLVEAITNNFSKIARDASLGNAAGYRLVKVNAKNKTGIIGGKGGVELIIIHTGMPLANGIIPAEQKTSVVWIDTDEQIDHDFQVG